MQGVRVGASWLLIHRRSKYDVQISNVQIFTTSSLRAKRGNLIGHLSTLHSSDACPMRLPRRAPLIPSRRSSTISAKQKKPPQ
jgi:hypothetical protein